MREQWLAGYGVYLQGDKSQPFPTFDEYLAECLDALKPAAVRAAEQAAEDLAAKRAAKRARSRFRREVTDGII